MEIPLNYDDIKTINYFLVDKICSIKLRGLRFILLITYDMLQSRACIALQDPYCGWFINTNTCDSIAFRKEELAIQNVSSGIHQHCPSTGKVFLLPGNYIFPLFLITALFYFFYFPGRTFVLRSLP